MQNSDDFVESEELEIKTEMIEDIIEPNVFTEINPEEISTASQEKDYYRDYRLPYGWMKICKKRKNSKFRLWDSYLISPIG